MHVTPKHMHVSDTEALGVLEAWAPCRLLEPGTSADADRTKRVPCDPTSLGESYCLR